MPLAAPFRTKLMYNNFLYVLAAAIAEKLTGQSWEELIRMRIFEILGMSNSSFIDQDGPDFRNIATPHMTVKGKLTSIPIDVHRFVVWIL